MSDEERAKALLVQELQTLHECAADLGKVILTQQGLFKDIQASLARTDMEISKLKEKLGE